VRQVSRLLNSFSFTIFFILAKCTRLPAQNYTHSSPAFFLQFHVIPCRDVFRLLLLLHPSICPILEPQGDSSRAISLLLSFDFSLPLLTPTLNLFPCTQTVFQADPLQRFSLFSLDSEKKLNGKGSSLKSIS
jgi:hypothetical protein